MKKITYNELKEMFTYDPSTGSFVCNESGIDPIWLRYKSTPLKSRKQIRIDGRAICAKRLVLLYMNGEQNMRYVLPKDSNHINLKYENLYESESRAPIKYVVDDDHIRSKMYYDKCAGALSWKLDLGGMREAGTINTNGELIVKFGKLHLNGLRIALICSGIEVTKKYVFAKNKIRDDIRLENIIQTNDRYYYS